MMMTKITFPLLLTIALMMSCSQTEKKNPAADDNIKDELTKLEESVSLTEKKNKQAKAESKKKKNQIKDVEPNKTKKAAVEVAPYPTQLKKNSKKVSNYCKKVDRYFKKYDWEKSHCNDYSWNHVRNSHWGDPLIWFVYGEEDKATIRNKNVTLILCGVHGDEITPVKFCFDLLQDIKKNPKLVKEDSLIAIAPIANPDSFFKKKPTRTNGRGVDINRNFPTRDWNKSALHLWKTRYRKNKRRFPGKKALSEQETIFQVNLIKRYKPNKIISVHAPLTMLDYDGPTFGHKHGHGAKNLLEGMSRLANKYKISNYPFFPGSLGNYAGNERKIPTYTLELPNSDWNKTRQYYAQFRDAIHLAIAKNLKAN